jgi:pimeloyl-ACP methyl ester carboxylesterase
MFKVITGKKQLDFQINRILTYGELASNEKQILEYTKNIKTLDEWYRVWKNLGEISEVKKEYMHSAYAYRMAEFFLKETHPEKHSLYLKSVEYFYKGFDELGLKYEIIKIPYQNTSLHSLYFKAVEEKGIIVVCGGYDSFIEEFVLAVKDFVDDGYTIILFEGDGQGKTLKNGLPLIHNWERPTKAVLDYYDIKECAMIGISWGGYLALRAAAYEKRIRKVIAYDVLDDGVEVMTNIFPSILRKLLRREMRLNNARLVNFLVDFLRKKSIIADWGIMQGMYITKTKTAFEFYQELKKHVLTQEICDNLECDVLLLAGEKDHYIPKEQYFRLKEKIHNANSLKCRLFTVQEGGEQHCQIGNYKIAIDEMMKFIM